MLVYIGHTWYTLPMSVMEFGRQYGSKDARAHLPALLDAAIRGDVAVVRRGEPVVMVRRDLYDAALGPQAPFDVLTSIHNGEVALWLATVPVQATGSTWQEAEDNFLDALVDYAALWAEELRHAPNHTQNAGLVRRVSMYAANRDELRRVVFPAD